MIGTVTNTDGVFVRVVLRSNPATIQGTETKVYWMYLVAEREKDGSFIRSFRGPFKNEKEAYGWVVSNNMKAGSIKYVIVNENEI